MIYTLDQHEVDFWNDAGNTFGSSLALVIREVAGDLSKLTGTTPNTVSIRESQLTPTAFNGLLAATEADTVFAHTSTVKATSERLLLISGVLHARLSAAVSARMEERLKLLSAPLAEVVEVDFRRAYRPTPEENAVFGYFEGFDAEKHRDDMKALKSRLTGR